MVAEKVFRAVVRASVWAACLGQLLLCKSTKLLIVPRSLPTSSLWSPRFRFNEINSRRKLAIAWVSEGLSRRRLTNSPKSEAISPNADVVWPSCLVIPNTAGVMLLGWHANSWSNDSKACSISRITVGERSDSGVWSSMVGLLQISTAIGKHVGVTTNDSNLGISLERLVGDTVHLGILIALARVVGLPGLLRTGFGPLAGILLGEIAQVLTGVGNTTWRF